VTANATSSGISSSSASHPFRPVLIDTLSNGYNASSAKADALAGLTVAIVAVPLSLAIAVASGLSPDKGLIAAIIGGFLVSALGGSRFQIGGPAGAFIVLVASIVSRHGHDGLLIAMLMGGVILAVFGWLRHGRFIHRIPHGVLVGFTAGIAVIIAASQIKDAFGLTLANEPAALLPKLQVLATSLPTLNWQATAIFLSTVAVVLLLQWVKPSLPGFLIAIAIAALLAHLLALDVTTISGRFGALPSTLPMPALPAFDVARLLALLPDALAIALLGALESLLSAVVVDTMAGTSHKPEAELVGQGAANIATALFGGMCVTGTIARTATNFRAGAVSPISGMLHAVFLLGFMAVAAPLVGHVPLAALAGILAIVCWKMADIPAFEQELTKGFQATVVVIVTFGVTIFVDLILGIASGCFVALFLGRLKPLQG
jgi:sulfate permease, SulP family